MRVQTLHFKNLNSLAGEWLIDLDHQDYRADGIFAITGPTGAGKSTILDALCLALYGRTPRLSKISKNTNEIMSRHTGECFAEVTFATQSGSYRCQWSQHRSHKSPEGELQQPRHELSHADSGKIIDDTIKGVAEQIALVTGMDFHRFTRSMLLAQGGFAAFLQASPDERAPILEQITGTEIYSRISVHVHELWKQESETLSMLRAEVAGISVLSEADEDTLRVELEDARARETDLNASITHILERMNWLRRIDELQDEIQHIIDQEAQVQLQLDAFAPDRERLRVADAAATIAGEYAELSATRRQQTVDEDALAKEQASISERTRAAELAQHAYEEATNTTADARAELEEKQALFGTVRRIDQTLGEREKDLQALIERAAAETTRIEELEAQLNALQTQQDEAKAELARAQEYLSANAADEWLVANRAGVDEQLHAYDAAKTQLAETKARLRELGEMCEQSAEHHRNGETKLSEAQRELNERARDVQTATDELNQLLGDRMLREHRAEHEGLLREQALAMRIRDLEEERKSLEDGKPCPLCGATEHPYAHDTPRVPSDIEQRISACAERIQAAEEQEAKLRSLSETEAAAKQHLLEVRTAVHSAAREVEHARERFGECEARIHDIGKDVSAREKRIKASLSKIGVDGLSETPVEELREALARRLDTWQEKSRARSSAENAFAETERQVLERQTKRDLQTESLRELEERIASLTRETDSAREERRRIFGDADPDTEEALLKAAIVRAENAEKLAADRFRDARDAVQHSKSRAEALSDAIERRAGELEEQELTFATGRAAAGFPTEKAYTSACLSTTARDDLRKTAQRLDTLVTQLSATRADREGKRNELLKQALTTRSLEALTQDHREQSQALNAVKDEIATKRHVLRENEAARGRLQDKEGEVRAQEAVVEQWDALHTLIGSADGKKYRNFAQGLTFELVITHANRRLLKLTDRYLLTREAGNELELSVIDTYQAGEIRSAKNLSGGESFLVSLALALGLSQMAGKHVRVDSLFLDEGFGTLDEEALDTALETLSGLQRDGTVIGVISHVSALKERIPTQIQVIPDSGGKSRVSGPGCRRVS
ncbi:MAG: AAA family ATPase [bacterium]